MAGLIMREHRVRVGLTLGGVRRSDGVNDGLGLLVADFWFRARARSVSFLGFGIFQEAGEGSYAGSSQLHCEGGFGRCYALDARSWSRA